MTIGNIAIPIAFLFIIGIIALCLYLLPSFIAWARRKKQLAVIIVINIFLGATGIGWIVALIWAVMREESDGK